MQNSRWAINFTLYKGNSKKYKGKCWKSVFWYFVLLNLLKSCSFALVSITEVLTHLLTPILAYIFMTGVRWHMRQIWHFWHFWHKWHICYPTFVMSRYSNMGVKRCVRTSGMHTNDFKQLVNEFTGSKFLKFWPLTFSFVFSEISFV